MMDEATFRQLLHESEGARLDFKREQYRFVGAEDSDKSELLKDLLAFANSWRSEIAYIVIGVTNGEPNSRNLLGIDESDHVDDASVQQFVNSKLNRRLVFSYHSFTYEGKTFGVYEVPVQQRPFYSKIEFHRVRQKVVYYRQGSSCAIATPDEVALMGRDDAARRTSRPQLTVRFADPETREPLSTELHLTTTCHVPHDRKSFPDHCDPPRRQQITSTWAIEHPPLFTGRSAREDFWRELADFLRDERKFSPLLVVVTNSSPSMASTVELELTISAEEAEVREGCGFSEFPESHFDMSSIGLNRPWAPPPVHSDELLVSRRGNQWVLKAKFDGIRPRQTQAIRFPVFVAPHASGSLEIEATCYAAELPEPSRTPLTIVAQVDSRPPLTLEELEHFRFEEAQHHLREQGQLDDTPDDVDK